MATYVPKYGLKKIEFADAVLTNTDPTVLNEIPFTKVNTAAHKKPQGNNTDVKIEESNTPLVTLKNEEGVATFEWVSYLNDPQLKASLLGGTYTPAAGGLGATYADPVEPVTIKKFLKVTGGQGHGVKFYNALLTFEKNGIYSKEGLPEYTFKATAQAVNTGSFPVIEFDPPTA